MTMTHPEYWLDRYHAALQSAASASGERSRCAYTDLARHYWSMHMMVAGRAAATRSHAASAQPAASMQCAA